MKTMEINKVVAAILMAGVVAMLLGFVAKLIIPDPGADGDGHAPNLFAHLAPAPFAGGSTEPAGPEPIAAFLASATVEDGMRIAKKCAACHTFEPGGPNKVGPNLANVVGAARAQKDYAYSSVLQKMGGEWTYENLNKFLYKPRDYAPGTKMGFPGLKKPEDRAAVIAYLRSVTENPPPLPDQSAAPATDAAGPKSFADLKPAPDAGGSDEPAGPEPIAAFLASATVEDGMRIAKKCAACHTFEPGGPNKVGPNLANVVGAARAQKDYAYSSVLQKMGGEWTYENLNKFLYKPRDYAPGTKMGFPGLKKPEDRAAVIAYLRSVTENPPPLPDQSAAPATDAAPATGGGAPAATEDAKPADAAPKH